MIKPSFLISVIALFASCTIIDTETDSAMSHSSSKEIRLNAEVEGTITLSRAAIGENGVFSATVLGWETAQDATTYSGLPLWTTDTENITASSSKASAVAFKDKQYYQADGGKTFMKAFSPVGTLAEHLYTFSNIAVDGSTDVLVSDAVSGTKSAAASALTFGHALTQLTFQVVKGESIAEDDPDEVLAIRLNDIRLPVGFDLLDNRLTLSDLKDLDVLNRTTGNGVVIPKNKPVQAGESVMVAPVTGDAELSLAVVTNHGELNVSKITSTTDNEFRAGTSYTVTLTFMRKDISSTATVTGWIKGEGGATVE